MDKVLDVIWETDTTLKTEFKKYFDNQIQSNISQTQGASKVGLNKNSEQ